MFTRRLIAQTTLTLLLGAATLFSSGCGPEAEAMPPLEIGAAFTNLKSVKICNRDGTPVTILDAEEPEGNRPLTPGDYYLDIEDHHGNGVFAEDGTMNFVPEVTGAELDLTPHRLTTHDRPMPRIIVGGGESGNQSSSTDKRPGISQTRQAVHTFGGNQYWMRSRVVWEAARAMVGPGAAGRHYWPLETVNSRYRYASEDPGAWSSMRRAYGYSGNVSCTENPNRDVPCRLTIGPDDPHRYEVQNGWYKGGQCKAFSNLLIYRSGVHHGNNWSFRILPTDSRISGIRGSERARPGHLQAGDILRMPYGHSAIVVRVIDANRAVVLDSNWMGGNGWENVATHIMRFRDGRDKNDVGDLYNYYRLACVYNGSC